MTPQNRSAEDSPPSAAKLALVILALVVAVTLAGLTAYRTLAPPKVEIIGNLDVGGKGDAPGKPSPAEDPSVPTGKVKAP